MFGLSVSEVAIILVVALIVLGPQKLPDLAKQLGRGLREFRKAAVDLQTSIEDAARETPPPPRIELKPAEHLVEQAPKPDSPTPAAPVPTDEQKSS